ncbi:MAG TPA: D-alanine--D-alanine ligase family protein [Candidatus Methylomirabilis sp.]|nr:D-alanine--D-alanine ligase family protein [Candidatus Methylomirabilis sp.]
MARMRVGILFGGRSGEHEVSIASARSVLAALDRSKYDVISIGITHDGEWLLVEGPEGLAEGKGSRVGVVPGASDRPLVRIDPGSETGRWLTDALDVVFPVLHGTYGEDGTVQGLLELLGLPYVGPGVMASAVGMDKVAMKTAFHQAGLPLAPHHVLLVPTWREDAATVMRVVEETLGYPMFVKPSNLGSSVGVSKVEHRTDLPHAIEAAFRYDRKVLVERGLDCRELECGVLGNDRPEASVVAEIIPKRAWYDYQAKYEPGMSEVRIPAPLPPTLAEAVRAQAIRAYRAIDCAGMARVDFFLERATQTLYVNEINTIPGFTATSVYPKLWEASGVMYPDLLDRLIRLALERHRERSRLLTTHQRVDR